MNSLKDLVHLVFRQDIKQRQSETLVAAFSVQRHALDFAAGLDDCESDKSVIHIVRSSTDEPAAADLALENGFVTATQLIRLGRIQ